MTAATLVNTCQRECGAVVIELNITGGGINRGITVHGICATQHAAIYGIGSELVAANHAALAQSVGLQGHIAGGADAGDIQRAAIGQQNIAVSISSVIGRDVIGRCVQDRATHGICGQQTTADNTGCTLSENTAGGQVNAAGIGCNTGCCGQWSKTCYLSEVETINIIKGKTLSC